MGDYKYPGWRTYIIYHGTTMKNALRIQLEGFRCSYDGMLGPGVYPSRDKEKASHYPKYVNGQHLAIIIVRVRVAKVKRIDYQGHPLQKTLYQHGYDTAWVPPSKKIPECKEKHLMKEHMTLRDVLFF
uniref:PARP catalytic domain-containing protein n=1 Tax=Cyprinus carpio TaxID=7962 RepID=A0A8C2I148_CYPCA